MLKGAQGRRCFRCLSRDSPTAPAEDHAEAVHPAAPVDVTPQQMNASWKSCDPWRAHTGAGVPWRTVAHEGTQAGAGEQLEEEGTVERSCYGWTAAPILHPLHHSGLGRGRGAGVEGAKLTLKRRQRHFSFCLCFSPLKAILICN